MPLKWAGTRARLKELGIEIQRHEDARVAGTGIPGTLGAGPAAGEAGTEVTSWWAPRWAVLVCEADPCNDDAKDWALARAVAEEEFKNTLDTIAMLADVTEARVKMAAFVMEMWPGPGG